MEAQLNLMLNPGKQLTGNPSGLCNSGPTRVGRAWVQFSRLVVFNSLRPHELQHARPPCPSPTPGVHSDHVRVSDAIQPSHPRWSPLLLCPIPPSIRVLGANTEVNKTEISVTLPLFLVLRGVQLFATTWTAVHQAPQCMRFFQAETLDWVAIPCSRGSS